MRLLIDASCVAASTHCLQDVVDPEDLEDIVTDAQGIILDEDALSALHALVAAHEVTVCVPHPRYQSSLVDLLREHGFAVRWSMWSTALHDADIAVTARRSRANRALHVPALSLHHLDTALLEKRAV